MTNINNSEKMLIEGAKHLLITIDCLEKSEMPHDNNTMTTLISIVKGLSEGIEYIQKNKLQHQTELQDEEYQRIMKEIGLLATEDISNEDI